ncbi:nSTAND1 domain-containing NTPase [Sphaerisporangium corydalis]|uniref:Novel STAND NTPase 1 domain-containing protein n=1 Tax=Sphaerisporangium corydalis TaxID=1441875 RepID=A0ABV9EPS3_9ACTN|nr:hypothetical protein [Sphaerisporangium corydalis]
MADGEGSGGRLRARIAGAGGGLLRMSPYALLAALSASALAPLVPLDAAGVGIIAGVGTNVLSEVITRSIDALRKRNGRRPTEDELEAELAERLTLALTASTAESALLKEELAGVLGRLDTAGIALEAAVDTGDERLQRHLTEAFAELGADFTGFGFLLAEVNDRAALIQEALHRQDIERRDDRERLRGQSVQLRLIRDDLARRGDLTRRDGPRRGPSAPEMWTDGCPYRGLWPFQQEHATIFYGRERMTMALAGRLAERVPGVALLAVTGASGAGKSSLLRAGLLPAISRGLLPIPGSHEWPQMVLTPTRTPLDEIAVHLALLGGTEPAAIRKSLQYAPHLAHLIFRQALLAHQRDAGLPPGSRLLVVVDQFEEVFTGDPEQSRAFVNALLAAVREPEPRVLVVLGVRGDYWGHCAAYPDLAEVLQDAQFMVGPMRESELRRAVTAPAVAAGLDIEPGLVDLLLGDLGAPSPTGAYEVGTLPLLSQSMLLAWEAREGDRLTIRGYGASGGVLRAVESSAEAAYGMLTPPQRDIARDLVRRLVAVEDDGRLLRVRSRRDDLGADGDADVERVLAVFTGKRLLVRGEHEIELSHDVLLHAWPRLRSWLEDDVAGRVLLGELLKDAGEWEAIGHDRSVLYRGVKLAAVREARVRWEAEPDRHPPLTGTARAFLAAGLASERRGARLRRLVVTAMALLLVTALAAAGIAVRAAGSAGRERDRALSKQYAAESLNIGDADPVRSRLLAVAAARVEPTAEALHAMSAAVARPGRAVVPIESGSEAVAYSSDGERLFVGTGGGVQIRDSSRGTLLATIPTRTGTITDLAVSDGGDLLAVAGQGITEVWSTKDGKTALTASARYGATVNAVAISPDGTTVLSAGDDGRAHLLDVATGKPARGPLRTGDQKLLSAAFAPDGKTVATGAYEGTIRLWDARTGRRIGEDVQVPGGTPLAGVRALAFSPDGRSLVSGSANGYLRYWDAATLRPGWGPFGEQESGVQDLAFSKDGGTLVVGDIVGGIRLRDGITGELVGQPLDGHSTAVRSLALAPDGRSLASVAQEGTVRLWDITVRQRAAPSARDDEDSYTGAGLSPSGGLLVTAAGAGRPRLWDTATGDRLDARLGAGPGAGVHAWFLPDGRRLVTLGEDGTVRVWDTVTGGRVAEFATAYRPLANPVALSAESGVLAFGMPVGVGLVNVRDGRAITSPDGTPGAGVQALAVSPDGRTLAVGGFGAVTLWNVGSRSPLSTRLQGVMGRIRALAFSPDGRLLAAGGADGMIRLWNLPSGTPAAPARLGRTRSVTGLAFSPDGATLAAGSEDQAVRLWDVRTGRQIGDPIRVRTADVSSLSFSADGTLLATASGYGVVADVWATGLVPDPLARICRESGADLRDPPADLPGAPAPCPGSP